MVSTPVTVINPRLVEKPIFHDPVTNTTSPNWAGLAIDYPGDDYTDVNSWFTVPAFSQQGTGTSHAAIWIGLGGWLDNPIIQEGIDGIATGGVTSYAPWYEYYPKAAVYPAFTMSPGDVVEWDVWECDSSENYGPSSHGFGCFYWYDSTKHTVLMNKLVQIQSGQTFTGKSCEGIIERVGSSFLSWWPGGATVPFNCWDFGGTTTYNVSTDPYLNINMMNGSGQAMASAAKSNPDTAIISWNRSH
jgi:hypothetical protein